MIKETSKTEQPCTLHGVTRSFSVGDVVELEIYPEICCELCNDVIHNHMDCPVCGDDYAGTDQHGYIEDTDQVECEECGTVYKKVSDSWHMDCKAEIVTLNCG